MAVLAVTGLLVGCSSGGSAPMASMPSANAHNAQDITFAQSMIVHHTGAIAMADLGTTRASSTKIKDLAAQIKAAQQPEIDEMTAWLKGWGEPVTMPGMTPHDMAMLSATAGPAFDKEFLTLMIQHHKNAVSMANDQLSKGQNTAAKKLAQSIISSQSKEIDSMRTMLTSLG